MAERETVVPGTDAPSTTRTAAPAVALFLGLAVAGASHAAVLEWSGLISPTTSLDWSAVRPVVPFGGGPFSNWNTGIGGPNLGHTPQDGDSLVFAQSEPPPSGFSNNNDIADLQVSGITFNRSGFTLNGNAITSTGDIVMSTNGGATVNLDITLGASQFWAQTSSGSSTFEGLQMRGDTDLNGATLTLDARNTFVGVEGFPRTGIDVSGAVSGNGQIEKQGPGVVNLSGANTFVGLTSVLDGTLQLNANENLGAAANSLLLSDGGLRTVADFTLSRTTQLIGEAGINVANGTTLIHDGFISGTGGLTKSGGTGLLVLVGGNNYSGGTRVELGTIQVSQNSNLGHSSGDLDLAGGGLFTTASFTTGRSTELTGVGGFNVKSGTTFTHDGVISGTGALQKSGQSGTLVLGGANTYSGGTLVLNGTLQGTTTSLQGDISNDANVSFDQDASGTYAGTISGTGSLTKSGTGVVRLTGTNTHSGGTTVAAGTLEVNQDSNLGGAGGLTLAGGGLFTTDDIVTYRDTTLVGVGGFNVKTGKVLHHNGVISGSGGLQKSGQDGTLVLGGANTYSGPTTIAKGGIALFGTGSIAASSSVDVASGAFLDASETGGPSFVNGTVFNQGTITGSDDGHRLVFNGAVTGAGAFLGGVLFADEYRPGNSPALVSHGNTAFGTGSTLGMEIGGLARGTGYDAIDALSLALGGTLEVSLIDLGGGASPFAPGLGDFFDLLIADSITGMFADVDLGGAALAFGLAWDYGLLIEGGKDVFRLAVVADPTAASVPEPTALALALALLPVLVLAARARPGRAARS